MVDALSGLAAGYAESTMGGQLPAHDSPAMAEMVEQAGSGGGPVAPPGAGR
jgi:hypothetical protein